MQFNKYTHTHTHTHNVDRRWCLRVARSFGRKTRRLPNDVVQRRKQGTSDEREETAMGTGTKARTGGSKSTGMSTRVGKKAGMGTTTGAGTRAKTGTVIGMSVERREDLKTYEVVIEVKRRGDANE